MWLHSGLSYSMQDLVPWPEIKPSPPALGMQSLSHWTTREALKICISRQADPLHHVSVRDPNNSLEVRHISPCIKSQTSYQCEFSSSLIHSMGQEESDMTERLPFHFSLSCTGEGNGSPLQCSFLENPRDGGAWWAAVYGVTQGRTRLKWLSSSINGFPGGASDKEPACQCRSCSRRGSTPGLGRPPGEGRGNPPRCSCLENSTHRGARWATVHGVAKGPTQLSDIAHARLSTTKDAFAGTQG